MNGDKQDNWNISVQSNFSTLSNLPSTFQRIKIYIPTLTVQNIMQKNKCLLFHCVWYQHKINQSHYVACNNGFVIDGLTRTKVLSNDFPLKNFILKFYGVQQNPNVRL